MNEQRLAGVDFVRAVACLMVLIHHFALRLDLNTVSQALHPAFYLARFGNFGVAVFFVLSGFLLAKPFWAALDGGTSMPSIRVYALRRAARILPGFWLALTVGFVLSMSVFGEPIDIGLAERFIAGAMLISQFHWSTFFPVTINGPLWSVPFEVTSYILLPLAFALLFRSTTKQRWLTRLLWIAVIAGALAIHGLIVASIAIDPVGRGWQYGLQGGAKEWMPRFNPIGFFAIFAIGSLAAGVQNWIASLWTALPQSLGIAALVAAIVTFAILSGEPFEGYGLLGIPYGFPLFPLSVAAILVIVPLNPRLGPVLDCAPIRFIASVSFGIYVWQDIVIHLMKEIAPWSFSSANQDSLILWLSSCLVATCLILLVATASFHLVEKPVIRWAKRLERHRDN